MIDLYNFQQNVARFYEKEPPVDYKSLMGLSDKIESLTLTDKQTVSLLIGEVAILLARISNEVGVNMDYAIASTWWLVNHAADKDGKV